MPRSAAVILILGLMLPAEGQSGSPQPGGFRKFAPRNRPAATAGDPRREGRPSNGQFPPGYQLPGPGYPSAGNGPGGYSASGIPQAGPPGMNPPMDPNGAAPAQGFLLDARNARAKKGRVPNGFGDLGLSRDQRERIYGIQSLYDGQVKRLETLIERLKAEEDLQYQRVLTDFQRRMYHRYLMEKARRAGE